MMKNMVFDYSHQTLDFVVAMVTFLVPQNMFVSGTTSF
jgi:hypothetical protein